MFADLNIYLGVALAGLVSFLSPCVLPLVPPYLGYLGGTTRRARWPTRTGIDAAGVAAGRARLAVLRARLLDRVRRRSAPARRRSAQLIQTYKAELSMAAGLVIILFGLHFLGLAARFRCSTRRRAITPRCRGRAGRRLSDRPRVRLRLDAVRRADPGDGAGGRRQRGEPAAPACGCWLAYSLGLGVPFILAAIAIRPFMSFMQRFKRHLRHDGEGDGRGAGADRHRRSHADRGSA